MSVGDVLNKTEMDFEKILGHLKDEFARLQIGRASAALVEGISVDLYGSAQPLKNVAGISIPEARLIQIQPWDRSALGPIEKAIIASGSGLNPVNDGVLVRINIPALTEERRAELCKVVWRLAEEAKIAIRNSRQDAHNQFKKMKSDNLLTEDDLRGADKKLQDKVDQINKKVEEVALAKEKDIMTV